MSSLRERAHWLILAFATVLFAVGFWPGHMNNDSLFMIEQASGAIELNDHHSPILTWIWSLGWPLGLRPGPILVLQVAGFLVGGYLIARAAFGRVAAAFVAVGVAFFPAVFGNLGVVGRDAWFLTLLALLFGFVVLAARRPDLRRFALVAAAFAGFFCLASRQNAAAAVVIAAVAGVALVLWPRLASRRRWARAAIVIACAFAVTVSGVVVASVAPRILGADRANPEQYLYLYDLAGLSVREGESEFPSDVYPSADVATLAATSSIDTIIPLAFGDPAPIPMPRSPQEVSEMRDAWTDTITDDPLEYLDWRFDVFMSQIGIDSPGVFIYHPTVDPNMRGYEIAFDLPNDLASGYQELFADEALNGHWFHLAWIYLLLAIPTMTVLLPTPGAPRVVGGLALCAWTYQVGLFFGTMGTQWRFEFPVAAITVIAATVAVKVLLDQHGERRHRGTGIEVSPADAPERPSAAPIATASG